MWPFNYLGELNAGSGNGMGTGMLRGGLYEEMRYVRIVRLESKMFSGGGAVLLPVRATMKCGLVVQPLSS